MNKIKTKIYYFLFLGLFLFSSHVSLAQWNPEDQDLIDTYLPAGSIYGITENLMLWILGLFGFFGVIGFVISGILYLTSAGNEEQIKKAKTAMTWSLVGVVVGLSGLIILYSVSTALDADPEI